jgi:hypothetical protein
MGPGEKIIAVNNKAYTDARLKDAIRLSKLSKDPIELIVSNTDEFQVVRLDYHDGERYPHLERVAAQPDLLGDIIKPLTKPLTQQPGAAPAPAK